MYHGTEGDKGDYNDYGDDMNESEIPREWWRHTQTGDKTEYAATHETACPEALDATYLQIHDLCKNEHEAPKVELVYTKTSGGYEQLFWGEWKRPADGKSICDDKTVRDLNMYKFLPGVYTADCETDADCPHTTNDCTLHCVQQVGRQEKKCEPRGDTGGHCMTWVQTFWMSPGELEKQCSHLPWTKEHEYKPYEDPNAPCMEHRKMWEEKGCHVLESGSMQCGDRHMTGVQETCDEAQCKALVRLTEKKTCAAYCAKHHMVCVKACQAGEHDSCPHESYAQHFDCHHAFESENAVCQCEPNTDQIVLDPREVIWGMVKECTGYLKRYTKCVREEYCDKDPKCGDMLPDEKFYHMLSKWSGVNPPKCISIPTATAKRLRAVNCPFMPTKGHGDDEHMHKDDHKGKDEYDHKDDHAKATSD